MEIRVNRESKESEGPSRGVKKMCGGEVEAGQKEGPGVGVGAGVGVGVNSMVMLCSCICVTNEHASSTSCSFSANCFISLWRSIVTSCAVRSRSCTHSHSIHSPLCISISAPSLATSSQQTRQAQAQGQHTASDRPMVIDASYSDIPRDE